MDDWQAIANLKARYCAAADLAPEDRAASHRELLAVFANDVAADYGFALEGGEKIAEFLSDMIAGNSEWMVHTLHTPRIEVRGDTATGDWTVNARMKRREGGQVDLIVGRYRDEFLRDGDGWKIRRIAFRRYE